MENSVLNKNTLPVFIIIAESLEGWKNIASAEGKEVLQKHYSWLAELKKNGKLILSGPTDFELTFTGKINPIGHTTGLIILNEQSREDAEKWASKDPFHTNEYRRNRVYSMRITATNDSLLDLLENLIITE